jgi:hypothetical protein
MASPPARQRLNNACKELRLVKNKLHRIENKINEKVDNKGINLRLEAHEVFRLIAEELFDEVRDNHSESFTGCSGRNSSKLLKLRIISK